MGTRKKTGTIDESKAQRYELIDDPKDGADRSVAAQRMDRAFDTDHGNGNAGDWLLERADGKTLPCDDGRFRRIYRSA